MESLFSLAKPKKGANTAVFYDLIKDIPVTKRLRERGSTLSEGSTERYLRFLRDWDWGITLVSLGKGQYRIRKFHEGNNG